MADTRPTESASTPLDDALGSLQTRTATAEFLGAHYPYSEIDRELLIEALRGARLCYYGRGETLIGANHEVPDHFAVVQQGLIRGTRRNSLGEEETIFESAAGDTFLNVAMLENRATRTQHVAAEDSFVVEIPRSGFDTLYKGSSEFRDYCHKRATALVDLSREQLRTQASVNLQAGITLNTPLSELVRRTPVVCGRDTPIAEAVRIMHKERVGSIVAVGPAHQALGIFTLHDLRALVAEGGIQLEQPLASAMTPDPLCLSRHLPAFEAAMLMVDNRIGHVVVTDHQEVVGVISQRDLFALQRTDIVHLSHAIARAVSDSELAALHARIQRQVHSMLAHGASVRQLTQMITRLNDALVERTVELASAEFEDLPAFTWLAFGSEARGEQTLSTDQDNGILFECGDGEAEHYRARLLPLAKRVNAMLDRIGFPLCRGNVMAGNPALCLSVEEWRRKYQGIIQAFSPEHLLDATIYLDCRAISGNLGAARELRALIASEAQRNTQFQHALAHNALELRPPLGLLRSFVTKKTAEGNTLDLKKNGLQPFVAAARVLALAHGLTETNTEDRLFALVKKGEVQRRDADAWSEAFSFLQLLRMRHHEEQLQRGDAFSNHIDPERLNPLDQRILKEAFRQAARLQTRLRLNYP